MLPLNVLGYFLQWRPKADGLSLELEGQPRKGEAKTAVVFLVESFPFTDLSLIVWVPGRIAVLTEKEKNMPASLFGQFFLHV